MAFLDTFLVITIVFTLLALVWAKVMDMSVYDVVMETKEMIEDIFK